MEANPQEYHDTFDQKELVALSKFKTSLGEEKEFITPQILQDDDFLVLFLRARKNDISKSKKMLMDYFKWRRDYQVEEIYNNFTFAGVEELRLIYPHEFHKTTKDGLPIFIQVLADMKVDDLFKVGTPEEIVKYSTKTYEKMVREIFPACTRASKKYVHQLFSIIDLRKLGRQHLNKKIYNLIKSDMDICQNYYPESLGESFIINAGFVFKCLFTVVKAFLDSKTKSKIKVYGGDYMKPLLERVDIENIPKILGGKCTCEPEGCLFSREGPWKTKPNDPVSEEIVQKRKALTENLMAALKVTFKDEEGEK